MSELHSLLTAVHRSFAGVYPDAAARLAATGFDRALGGGIVAFTAQDLYKEALQLDNASTWALTNHSPVTWEQTGGPGLPPAAHAASHQNGGSDEINVAGLNGVLADPQVPITENVQDVIGAMLTDSATIDFTYDDTAGTISATALGAAPSGAAGGDLAGTYPNPTLATKFKTSFVVFEFGDGKNASSLEANQIARIPYVPAGTIVRARIVGDVSGSAVVDIQKSTVDPPSFSSIAASAKPTLSSDVYVDDTTLTGWTTSLSAGNELRAVLESVTTCKQVTVVLEIVKS